MHSRQITTIRKQFFCVHTGIYCMSEGNSNIPITSPDPPSPPFTTAHDDVDSTTNSAISTTTPTVNSTVDPPLFSCSGISSSPTWASTLAVTPMEDTASTTESPDSTENNLEPAVTAPADTATATVNLLSASVDSYSAVIPGRSLLSLPHLP